MGHGGSAVSGPEAPCSPVDVDVDGGDARAAAPLEEQAACDVAPGARIRIGLAEGLTDVAAVHPLADPHSIEPASGCVDGNCGGRVALEQLLEHLGDREAPALIDVVLVVSGREAVDRPPSRAGECCGTVGEHVAHRPPHTHGRELEPVELRTFEDRAQRSSLDEQDPSGRSHPGSVGRTAGSVRAAPRSPGSRQEPDRRVGRYREVMTSADLAAVARRIHDDLPVVDGHNDLPWRLRVEAGGDLDAYDPGSHLDGFHSDIPRMLQGGVGAQWWSVYVPTDIADPFAATNAQIDLVEAMVGRDPRLEPATTAAEVRRIRGSGRIASLLGAEGGHSIENSLGKLAALAERGVRYMTLTHSDATDWADSATDLPRHGGLTGFGRNVVRTMNRLGMLVDLSHVAPTTMRDAVAVSTAPVIASHSNAYGLAPHPRNVPDEMIEEIGRRGGVVMVVFFPGFVVASTAAKMVSLFDEWRRIRSELEGDEAAIAAAIEAREAGMDLDRGTVADVVDHIEYIAVRAGVDAVGLGSDFDGMTLTPAGLEDVTGYPAITVELLRRGWSEGDIRKVLGDNTLRVMAAAEAVAG